MGLAANGDRLAIEVIELKAMLAYAEQSAHAA
jgi:hypothetical protein